jgi:hypothetical protein
MSPKDVAEHYAGLFANALESTGLIDVVEIKAARNQAHVLARVKREHERQMVHGPLYAMQLATIGRPIELFTGKVFFVKPNDPKRKLKYAWTFTVAAEDLPEAVNLLTDAVDLRDEDERLDIMEAPMPGKPQPQGDVWQSGGAGTKGVSTVGG